MPRTTLLRWTLLCLVGFILVGCAARPALEEPTFRVTNIQPMTLGLGEQTWRLTLRIDNPNNVALPVRALRYQVSLADMDFASGNKTDGFTIAARDSTSLDLDVTTHLVQSLPRLMQLLDGSQPSLGYRLSGDVEYGRFLRGTREFTQEGRLRF
ncbi:LEA type 2 family protein [Methylonatrum kenyense]|uniref:LEA type 2 family protein n=1 Tax=Methylonatrum kenyense TaxID=455253 RepID=UPI0020C0202F|nr:LEA type 2 family protein [Methylonatrum kenyense]MCK8515103.1 LEA type 2 family protein [Methylonatrum kenyense]